MASGGSSERQERLDKRNMDKEIDRINQQRNLIIKQIRKSAKIGPSIDQGLTEKADDDSMSKEAEMFPRLDSSLRLLRRKISFMESTRNRTPDRTYMDSEERNVSEAKRITGGAKETKEHNTLNEQIAELSQKLRDIETSRIESEIESKESERRLREFEERERNEKEERDMMKVILQERELEISNREVVIREKETALEKKIAEADRNMKGYEERIMDMERTMLQKFGDMERSMHVREQETDRKEAELKERLETVERNDTERNREIDGTNKTYTESDHLIYRQDEVKEKEVAEHGYVMHGRDRQTKELIDTEELLSSKGKEARDNLNIKLNLTYYSGVEPRPRNEATYEEWKMEVENVQFSYAEIVVMQAVRKSLKGHAKRIMLHLGPTATVDQVVSKLEDAFGNVASKDSILCHFFMTSQEENETVVEWGLRLEEMLLQAARKAIITDVEKNAMLKKRFWRGLRNEQLKEATRVHFESNVSFEMLRNRVRSEEFEIRLEKERSGTKPKARQYQQGRDERAEGKNDSDNLLKTLIEKMDKLEQKVNNLQQDSSSQGNGNGRGRGRYRGRGGGNYQRDQPSLNEPGSL